MNTLENFVAEVIQSQQSEIELPEDIVLDGLDFIPTIQDLL